MVIIMPLDLISISFRRRCDGIGRHTGLKIRRGRPRAGWSPATGTINNTNSEQPNCIQSIISDAERNLA